jgi:hypothetical protein
MGELSKMKITIFEGTYKGKKVMIRITGDPKNFLDASSEELSFVHHIRQDGEIELYQVKKGELFNIRATGVRRHKTTPIANGEILGFIML